ncbi:MAG: transcriptional regulator, LysR family [Gammaproteobacteria bacterium]|jgi:DNA-binding transcriptional LysR family regulator|nr:transcriptional regulator, LysR family [Gammaproteobacteria bacterium]
MELKLLEDFIALAHCHSFSRAAEVRNITQSGLSRRIRALERWMGAELVDRGGYPPALTAAGRLFHGVAEDVLQKLLDTRAIIRNEQRLPDKGIKIAAGHTIALSFLPGWLNTMSTHFGDLRARITPTNVHDSVLMLVNGNCELMFAYQHPDFALHLESSRYESLTVGRDVLMPVCRPKSPGVPRYKLPGTARQPLPHIGYGETTYFGRCVAGLLGRPGSAPYLLPRYESDMADVLKRMVLEGEGIAWLPRSLIDSELAGGNLIAAGGAAWTIELALRVYRDALNRDELTGRLWTHLKSVYPYSEQPGGDPQSSRGG